jgi:DASS family divalent anion:Na+ symporter
MATIVCDEAATTPAPEALEVLVRSVPCFRDLSRVDVARMIGELEEVTVRSGTLIVPEDAPTDSLYLLASGRVAVSVRGAGVEESLTELEAPAHFGEPSLPLAQRTGVVRALTDARLWKLPCERVEQLVHQEPRPSTGVAASVVERMGHGERTAIGAAAEASSERRPSAQGAARRACSPAWRTTGIVVALGVPLVLWPLPPPVGLSPQGWHVSLILLGAALGWLFEPVPDFVVALLMAAAWGIAELAPSALILAGFASSAWLVSVGAFALAVAMVQSGLLFRIALLSLSTFPPTRVGQILALLISGLLITPLVPLGMARVAAVAPLARDLAQALGYPARSRASATLAFAGLIGYGLFSGVFLTGLVMNFFVLDLLPPADRARFDWLTWFICAAPTGALMLVGAAGVLVLYPVEAAPTRRAELLRAQRRVLGPLSRHEQVTIAAVAVLLFGLLAQPVVRVDAAWLAVGAVAIASVGGSLDREHYRGAIDWGFLTLFGILLGTGGVVQSVGLDSWIADSLVPLAQAAGSPTVLVALVGLCAVACRLVLPWIPATLLLSLALVPAGPRLGLSPWVVGFVVLIAANTWLHPNQGELCRLTRDATGGQTFTDRHGTILGAAITVLTLAALAASVPYWEAVGVLRP